MTALEDIRTAIITLTPQLTSGIANLGPFVAKAHMRHILSLQYQAISGGGASGASCNVYDTWGTSNNLVDNFILFPINGSGILTSANTTPNPSIITIKQWPVSPRPDLAIGHIKESGVAQTQVSGAGFTVTMIYTDRPGGTF